MAISYTSITKLVVRPQDLHSLTRPQLPLHLLLPDLVRTGLEVRTVIQIDIHKNRAATADVTIIPELI